MVIGARRVTSCRLCGSMTDLHEVVHLGDIPLVQTTVPMDVPSEPDPAFPLGLVVCDACGLVQVSHDLPRDVIFTADYPYYSSVSSTLVAHSRDHVESLLSGVLRDRERPLVVEVASNDGYLLGQVPQDRVRVLGVEPSPGPAGAARQRGVPTVVEFLGVELARELRSEHGAADVVIANNVMAHVPDLHDFVGGLAELVSDDGTVRIENPWVYEMVQRLEFDTIYHEHYCYWSTTAVRRLLEMHGLHLNDVEKFPFLHGGTLRWHASRRPGLTSRASEILAFERAEGIDGVAFFADFATRVAEAQRSLEARLRHELSAGMRVAGYGAAAKTVVLLNSTGIGTDLIDFVVDANPVKQGRRVPGARIPILAPDVLLERRPDEVLIFTWNIADEIVGQQQAYLDAGGRFFTWLGPGAPREWRARPVTSVA
jgi:SAM-dependent methyltransferase